MLFLAFIAGAMIGAFIAAFGVAACAAGGREDACRACLARQRRGWDGRSVSRHP